MYQAMQIQQVNYLYQSHTVGCHYCSLSGAVPSSKDTRFPETFKNSCVEVNTKVNNLHSS
jgi:hypothetical protein